MNTRSDYGPVSRSKIPPAPLNLPSIHLLLQLADSPAPPPPPSSLVLPPLRLSNNAGHEHLRPFYSPSPSSASSCSSTRTSSSSPQSHEFPREYPRPAKRKQVKRACRNCQKACKGCADTRPCPRCIVHGIADSCVDAPRKSDRKSRGPERD